MRARYLMIIIRRQQKYKKKNNNGKEPMQIEVRGVKKWEHQSKDNKWTPIQL